MTAKKQKQIPFGNDNKESKGKKQVLPLRGRMTTKKITVAAEQSRRSEKRFQGYGDGKRD